MRSGRAELVRQLEAWIAEYLSGADIHTPVDERVAQRFALVYAAGRLATRYGVLPYSKAEILDAVRYCHAHAYSEAQVAAPTDEPRPSQEQLVRAVAKNIKRHRPTSSTRGRSLRRRR